MSLEDVRRELERIKRLLAFYAAQGLGETLDEPPFDPEEGVLHPLYTLEQGEDYYRVLVDLPAADLDTLQVYTENGELVIEAGLEREITFETPWSLERRVILRRYRRRITLPLDADPSSIRVRVHPDRKILEVIIPRRHL